MNLARFIRFLAQMNNVFVSGLVVYEVPLLITSSRILDGDLSVDFSFARSEILCQWFTARISGHFNMSPVDGVKETKHQKIQISEVEI